MLMQLSNSFLIATRVDAWANGQKRGPAAVPERLRDDLGLTGPEAELPGRRSRRSFGLRLLPPSLWTEGR